MCGVNDDDLDLDEEAILDSLAGMFAGRVCADCGEDIAPGEPCSACAEKRELLRQAFPQLHGDS